MELIETVVWVLAGFIPTLVVMEAASRLTIRSIGKRVSISKSVGEQEQKVRATW